MIQLQLSAKDLSDESELHPEACHARRLQKQHHDYGSNEDWEDVGPPLYESLYAVKESCSERTHLVY